MSTRANFLVKLDADHYQQYYCHCDGYSHGLGEDLRKMIVYSIGLQTFFPTTLLRDIVNDTISLHVREDNNGCGSYNREDIFSLKDRHGLHGDIEYLYVIDFTFQKGCTLYGKACWHNYKSWNDYSSSEYITLEDVIKDICKSENMLDLTKRITRKD